MKRGLGVASCWYGCGNTALPNPSTVRLGITGDGRLILHQGATDIGQGSNTVITQICADALGMPLADFELVGPDTALTPDCGKTSASRQTFITGKAAELSGRRLRADILRLSNMSEEATIRLDGAAIVISDGSANAVSSLPRCRPMNSAMCCAPKRASIRQRFRSTRMARNALCRLWLWRAGRRDRGRPAAWHGQGHPHHRGA